MRSRRSVLGLLPTVVGGGLLASGPAGATFHGRGDTARSSTDPTTVAGAIDPRVVGAIGLPEPLSGRFARERERLRSASIDDVDAVRGRATLHGLAAVGGRVAATGSFDPTGIESDLDRHDREFVAVDGAGSDAPETGDGLETGDGSEAGTASKTGNGAAARDASRFVAADVPLAIAVTPSAVRIGYGVDRQWALESGGGTRGVAGASAGPDGALAPNPLAAGRLRSVLAGDAVGYAALGSAARDRLAEALAARDPALSTAIEAADAVGGAIRADAPKSRVRYGLVASDGPFSGETVSDLAARAEADPAVESVAVHRDDPTVVLDATVETDALWDAHERVADRD